MLTALKGFIEPTDNDLSFLVTSADTRPLEVPLPFVVIVSKLNPDIDFLQQKGQYYSPSWGDSAIWK